MNSREKGLRAHALMTLGLSADAAPSPEEIKAAFTAAVKAGHTDTGGTGADMDLLKGARDLLLRQTDAPSNNACVQCKGVGIVRGKMGSRPCGACNGTGERHGR